MIVAGAAYLFIGMVGVSAVTSPNSDKVNAPTQNHTAQQNIKPKPVTTTSEEQTTEAIPCDHQKVNDATLAQGQTQTRQTCADGVKTIAWTVTKTDGKETGRDKAGEAVTKPAVAEIIAVGTKAPQQQQSAQASSCDPNYSGGCVPNVYPSDVDCAGGSGNGPYYVRGPVHVIGTDRYGLDRDGDGIACE
jgi:hypothetical protein